MYECRSRGGTDIPFEYIGEGQIECYALLQMLSWFLDMMSKGRTERHVIGMARLFGYHGDFGQSE